MGSGRGTAVAGEQQIAAATAGNASGGQRTNCRQQRTAGNASGGQRQRTSCRHRRAADEERHAPATTTTAGSRSVEAGAREPAIGRTTRQQTACGATSGADRLSAVGWTTRPPTINWGPTVARSFRSWPRRGRLAGRSSDSRTGRVVGRVGRAGDNSFIDRHVADFVASLGYVGRWVAAAGNVWLLVRWWGEFGPDRGRYRFRCCAGVYLAALDRVHANFGYFHQARRRARVVVGVRVQARVDPAD